MKAAVLVSIVSMFLNSLAWADRQTVICSGAGQFRGYAAKLEFAPHATLESFGRGNTIIPYELGAADRQKPVPTTTARVSITVPASGFKKPYSGNFPLVAFYEVNTLEKAGTGYSSRFNNKPYRAFHGYDRNRRWDAMVYFPDEVIGKNATGFPGLITIQMDLMDQGYYHIDLRCSARVTR